jgi:FkbM family methyltransferase
MSVRLSMTRSSIGAIHESERTSYGGADTELTRGGELLALAEPFFEQPVLYRPGMLRGLRRWWRGEVALTIRRRSDGIVVVSDGHRELAIVSPDRARRYSHGIASQIAKLMKRYRIGSLVPLSPGDMVVNCGANIGELALGLVEAGCEVIAIEPDPTTLKCLRINVPAKVEIVPAGLWKEDGSLTFYQMPDTADTSAINKCGPALVVEAARLDTLLEHRGRVRLLVGDAEGAEPEVLVGASAALKRIDYVSLDCGPERNGQPTAAECAAILRDHGFHILREDRFVVGRGPAA